jgi:hypothetical protein
MFLISLVGSAGQFVVTGDTVWKCPRIHFFVLKSLGVLTLIIVAAIMRKLGARLVGSGTKTEQLTVFQKILLSAFAVVAVLTLAFPDFPVVSAAVEICVFALVVLSVWWDFVKFALASNEVYSLVTSRLSSMRKSARSIENPGQVGGSAQTLQAKKPAKKAALRASKHLKRSMLVILLIAHTLFLMYVLLSSFWPINLPGICNARSVDKDARHVVETARFYVCDVFHVAVLVSNGMGIAFFIPSTRAKKKRQKQSPKIVAVGPTPVVAKPGGTAAPAESEDAAQKTVFETVVGCCNPFWLERAWYTKMRSDFFNRKAFATCLGLALVVDILLPLLVTGKISFGEAKVFHQLFLAVVTCVFVQLSPLCFCFDIEFLSCTPLLFPPPSPTFYFTHIRTCRLLSLLTTGLSSFLTL